MPLLGGSLVEPRLLLVHPSELVSPEFWINLYNSGEFGRETAPNLIVVVLARVVVAALLLLGARLLVGVLHRLIGRTLSAAARSAHGQRRLTTLQGILASALAYAVYFVAFILILFTFGITWKGLAPLLGAASILGLAIGFGAQKLVKDVITGLFILGEGQFDIGDHVTVNGVSGQVVDMGLRVTRLRDDQGRLYIIANGDIATVFNASRGNVSLLVEVAVQRTAPLDTAVALLRETAADALKRHGVPAADEHLTVRVVAMDAGKVSLRLVLWVPVASRDAIEDDVRRHLLGALAQTDLALA